MKKNRQTAVCLKLKSELHDVLLEFASDNDVTNISTLIRTILIEKLEDEGYDVPKGSLVYHKLCRKDH